jgi:peptide/nickel transport system substrate-binding protein
MTFRRSFERRGDVRSPLMERIGMHRFRGALALIFCAALVASGCGGGSEKGNSDGATDFTDTTGKRGGHLDVLSIDDVTSLDPGYWYYAYDYQALHHPTQRSLYGWKPNDTQPSPDLAAALPATSADGKTVTIKIKPNIKYSAPLQDRAVTSADVKYAIERSFLPAVQNGYSAVYYSDIVGSKAYKSGKADEVSGIETPDDTTLVLKLSKPVGVISNGQSLSLPATVPVPKDYAQKYDKGDLSTYGKHQVFIGPYMVKNDGKGNLTGYKAGRRIDLVRNPSWDAKTDYRPAYLDTISFLGGNDIDVASRRVLSGKKSVSGDYAAPPVNVLRSALATRKDQVGIIASQGIRYIALNTTVKPFDDLNVRRAAAAVIDRNALRLTRGGATLGPIATHYLAPGVPGFEEAGGLNGTFDFMQNPAGDLKLAQEYMKKAGYETGKYTGPELLMSGDNQPPASNTGEAVQSQLAKLGFKFNYRQVSRPTTFSKFCGSPKAKVAVCPNGGWGKDFFDAQSLLDPVFNGKNIVPVGNVNWASIDDPELNATLDTAVSETDPEERAKSYGEIDKTVTENAYVIPWLWDNNVNLRSEDVKGVLNRFNSSWDMSFTSLK